MAAGDERFEETWTDVSHPAAAARPRDSEPVAGMAVSERVRLLRPLDSGGMGSVWVAEHVTLGTEVAVKLVRTSGDPRLRERLSREAQLAARIDHPHAVRIFDHGETPDGTPFIVMELLDGETLAKRIERDGALGIDEVRRLASQVAGVLAEAHALGIAHRDIKPHNIVLLNATDELFAKVLDFGIAKTFEEADAASTSLTEEGEVVGTPVYMAPEQLVEGLPADARSDLWGLSVLAYEALTGQRPFRGRTRAAIGAAMLVGRFATPSSVEPRLTTVVDDFFERNLSAYAEQRETSAKDWAKRFDEALTAAPSQSAARRVGDGRLRIPDRLYGRQDEVATLLAAFDQAARGRSRLALVAGYSGIGKTSIVAATEAPLAQRGATFVGGKFDQFDRGTPYASVVQAFRALVRQMLRSDARDVWKERIRSGVAENLGAMVDVIPELEELVGCQPIVPETTPAEARSRFRYTFGRFVRAVASAERPLVLFLDDLQWADLPSLDLVASLVGHPESRHLLLIGAYRDNEVDATHPLSTAIDKIRDAGAGVDVIEPGPLSEDAVLDLVSDATDGAPGRVRLAVECYAKTRGNAFFLRRFLESLTEARLLRYDSEEGTWTWEISEIQAIPMAESVVDFVADEIRRMPADAREALGAAACIGARFDLAALTFALGAERGRAFERLRLALASELVVPQTEGTWLTGPIDVGADRMTFRFAHDRIRQAARSLISDEDAARVHQNVGRYLLEHLDPKEREERLFELVEHLNRGADEDLESTASGRLTELNLSAARRATASAAFEPAFAYYQRAHALLRDDAWDRDYDQTLAIHVEGARAAYLSGDSETMRALVEEGIERAEGHLDRVRVQEVEIQSLVRSQRFVKALARARAVLEGLGVSIPEAPTDAEVEAAVGAALAAIQERGADAILELPLTDDPEVTLATRIQKNVMSSAYLAVPQLLPILTANIVQATIEHGVCRESPYGFAVLALVLNASNMLELSAQVGAIARGLLDRVDDRSVRPSTLHVIACYVTAWTHPLRRSVEEERRVFQVAMDVGDLEYASWGLHVGMLNAFCCGTPLPELAETAPRDVAILRYQQQLPALSCSVPIEQWVLRLARVARADDGDAEGAAYDQRDHIERMRGLGFRGAVCVTASVSGFVRLILGDTDEAKELATLGLEYADGATATYNGVLARQTFALATLASVSPESDEADAALAAVAPHLDQLKLWCAASPANHAHRVAMVEAEIARVEGRVADAMERYDAAIAHAKAEGFVHEEGLANELAARWHRDAGRTTPADAYLAEARAAYERWGAAEKLERMG